MQNTMQALGQYRMIWQERFARKFCIRMRRVFAAILGCIARKYNKNPGAKFPQSAADIIMRDCPGTLHDALLPVSGGISGQNPLAASVRECYTDDAVQQCCCAGGYVTCAGVWGCQSPYAAVFLHFSDCDIDII